MTVRVLALTRYDRSGASSRMRTFLYREALAAHGVELMIRPLLGDDYIAALYVGGARIGAALRSIARRIDELRRIGRYDAIWLEKEALPWVPAFIELRLLPPGLPLIVDYDDAVFHRYDQHRSRIVRAGLGQKIDRVMARANLVVAGNDYLAERARRAGASRVEIVPTVVDLERYQIQPRPANEAPVIGWIGSPSTAKFLRPLTPVLNALSAQMPLRMEAIGARQDQLPGGPFVVVPWTEDGEVEALRRFNIGVMPLPDEPWERGKCGYKLIQYMAVGLPVVASPVGVNTKIVQEGVNGFLAADDEAWTRALTTLVADPALRKAFGEAGRRLVEQQYSLQVQAPRLAHLITETVRGRP